MGHGCISLVSICYGLPTHLLHPRPPASQQNRPLGSKHGAGSCGIGVFASETTIGDFLWALAALPVNAESWLVFETVDSAFRETVVNTRGSLAKESMRKVLRSPYSDI